MVDNMRFLIWFSLFKRIREEEQEKEKGSVTRKIVNEAVDKLPKDMRQYKIYVDNFYGGLNLVEDTHKRGFGFTLCCKSTRPSWLFKEGLNLSLIEYLKMDISFFGSRVGL
jgi:hypothetical protein